MIRPLIAALTLAGGSCKGGGVAYKDQDDRCRVLVPEAYEIGVEIDCTPPFPPPVHNWVGAWDGTTIYIWADRLYADSAVEFWVWHEVGHSQGESTEAGADRYARERVG